MADLMQVSGLWKNTSANGEMYLQGKLGSNVRILIFKNKYKTADNQPDYQIYFAPVERRENEGESAGGRGRFSRRPDAFRRARPGSRGGSAGPRPSRRTRSIAPGSRTRPRASASHDARATGRGLR